MPNPRDENRHLKRSTSLAVRCAAPVGEDGRTHTVCVTDDGFEFQGKTCRSLTKIALDITGAQWSRPRFFGLTKTSATATATLDKVLSGAERIPENSNG